MYSVHFFALGKIHSTYKIISFPHLRENPYDIFKYIGRWYLFSTSESEATGISGSCNDITHASIAYQGHHRAL